MLFYSKDAAKIQLFLNKTRSIDGFFTDVVHKRAHQHLPFVKVDQQVPEAAVWIVDYLTVTFLVSMPFAVSTLMKYMPAF